MAIFAKQTPKIMKKIFLLLLATASSFSQIHYGAKGGLNMTDSEIGANYKGEFVSENATINSGGGGSTSNSQITTQNFNQTIYIATSYKPSFYIGGFVEFPINKKGNLALKTELLYCQNGTSVDKKTADNQNPDLYYTSPGGDVTVGQLNIPILLKFTTNKKLAFLAGGYVGTIIFAETKSQGLTKDAKSILKNIDLGLNFGASYPINKNFAVDARYNFGLLNLDKTKETSGPFTAQGLFYNRSFHFGIEYQF